MFCIVDATFSVAGSIPIPKKQYYYAVGDDKKGPVSLDELKAVGISPDTLVWYEGLDNWTRAVELSEFTDLFGGLTPSAPSLQNVKEDLGDAADALGDAVDSVGDAAKDLADAAGDTLSEAADTASEMASEAAHAAGDMAHKAGDMLGGAADKVGGMAAGAGAAATGAMAGAVGAASGAFGKASGALGNTSAAMSKGFRGNSALEGLPPKNWKTESIIALVVSVVSCSCLAIPTGIIALIFAAKVDKQFYAGAHREAESSANTAKILFIITAVLVVLSLIIGLAMGLLGAVMENL